MTINWQPGLGLTNASTNNEIKEKVFQFAHDVGTLVCSTIRVDGITPTTRALEVHYLDDEKNLYIGLSHGKPVYQEIRKNPRVSCGLMMFSEGKLGISIRINAVLKEITDPAIFARYWKQNPGTTKLYSKGPENFRIFVMERGDGEVFDLCEDDITLRYRFGFGGEPPRPWRFAINENCVGCGACAEKCMKSVISIKNNHAVIDHSGCLECGICYETCKCSGVTLTE